MTDTTRPARIWPTIGLIATAALWAVSAAANYWAGYQYGTDELTRALWGSASLGSDLAKATLIFALTYAILKERWLVAIVAMLAFALCTVWSLRSAVMFSSYQIEQRFAERTHQANVIADKREVLRLRTQRAAYLSQQDIKLPGSGRPLREAILAEKERTSAEFERQMKEADRALDELKAAPAVPLVDPLAAMLGVDERTVAIATSVLFALLVEIVSATGFWIIAQSRSTVPKASAAPILDNLHTAPAGWGGGPSGGGDRLNGSPQDQAQNLYGYTPEPKASPKKKSTKKTPPSTPRIVNFDAQNIEPTSQIETAQIEREVRRHFVADYNAHVPLGQVYMTVFGSIPTLAHYAGSPKACPDGLRFDLESAMRSVGGRKIKRAGQVRFYGVRQIPQALAATA